MMAQLVRLDPRAPPVRLGQLVLLALLALMAVSLQ
jgi:hypothetical protein